MDHLKKTNLWREGGGLAKGIEEENLLYQLPGGTPP